MFLFAFFSYLAGIGIILADALRGLNYSLFLAALGGLLLALAVVFLIAGMLRDRRISQESPHSLP